MRGADGYTVAMFTMAKLDDFVPASNRLVADSYLAERRAQAHGPGVRSDVRERREGWQPGHCPGEVDSRAAVAGAVFDSKRTHADGATSGSVLLSRGLSKPIWFTRSNRGSERQPQRTAHR